MDLKNTVSSRIKVLRLAAGVTQQQLAEKTGLNVRYLSRLENSPQNITLEILQKIAIALNLSPIDLISPLEKVEVKAKELDSLDRAIDLLTSFKAQLKPKT